MFNGKIYLSSNLKYLRNINGKTQEEVASACNKKNTAVSNWEKGIREPDAVDLSVLSNLFNVSIDDLMIKDLRNENINIKNNDNELDQLLFSKAKDLSDEDKMVVMNVIDSIKRNIDNEDL